MLAVQSAIAVAVPNIALQMVRKREEVDVAIRAGRGTWPHLVTHRLLDMQFALLVSPKLAASVGGVHKPSDILKLPLLEPNDDWWLIWFKAHGLLTDYLATQTAPSMSLQTLLADAAIAGRGAALLTPNYFHTALADRRLIQPFESMTDEGYSYWLVYPETRRHVPKIKAFRHWIMAEAAKES